MPLYDYQCRSCGHRFEIRQGFDADTIIECPVCGQIAERQINVVPVIFKGSGWYVNDYGKRKSTLDGHSDGGNSHGHGHSHDHGHSHSHGGHSHSHDHAAPAGSDD